MSFIDVHAHLDRFSDEELDQVIRNAKQVNVSLIISSGNDCESNRKVLEIQKKYDIIKVSIGIYPPGAEGKDLDFDVDDELKFIEENKDWIILMRT